jgi:glutamyl-tRNA reductase
VRIFAPVVAQNGLNALHIVAFTHKNLAVSEIGQLHIDPENQGALLANAKLTFELRELMYLTTCNRIEFELVTDDNFDSDFVDRFIQSLYPNISSENRITLVESVEIFQGIDAIEHQLLVASSVDSMIVGEREIITQVRKSYDDSRENGLTGDCLRLLIRHTIETAKRVYTETNIAKRPVSVVSLAYHQLRDMNVPLDSRILIVGAGVTNTNMGKFLRKHGFTNFNVFNRTFSKAEQLASDLNGTAHALSSLNNFSEGFDIIITCTGSETHILTPEIYTQLLQGETDRKVVIDIAIPQDLSPEIKATHSVHHISVEVLQKISNENLKVRSREVEHVQLIIDEAVGEFKQIFKERSVAIAMREVPGKVKEIKHAALNEVFKNDVNNLDDEARAVLENVIGYMEKKYMSMPMLMAKEILLKK